MEYAHCRLLNTIYRGFDVVAAFVDYVGVDHGGFEVFMAKEFLHGADVVAVLEQLRPVRN